MYKWQNKLSKYENTINEGEQWKKNTGQFFIVHLMANSRRMHDLNTIKEKYLLSYAIVTDCPNHKPA